MLGLILIYFIWKQYATLATEYGKHKWGYGLLGIASYYAGTFLAGFLFAIIGVLIESDFVASTSDFVIGLLCVPFGLLTVWVLYRILKNQWSKAPKSDFSEALDADLIKKSEG